MISKKLSLFSLLLTFLFSLNQECSNQANYDYQSMPEQPYDFQHMDLTLTLEPDQHLARGVVEYEVIPLQDELKELILDIEESAVDGVTVDGKTSEYLVHDGKLTIQLNEGTKKTETMKVSVTWQSNSEFGLYKDAYGNFWSSKNPLAHRHWIPGFDHPRNELSFEAAFIIPNGKEVAFNGELVGFDTQSESTKKVTYASETAVPFTGLGFAFGDFEITEVTSGFTKVRLFSKKGAIQEEERAFLIKEAASVKKAVEEHLSREYPWESLNLVLLPDNFWEERNQGSGIIYLYENLGGISSQVKRGIYAQWFGEFHRMEQYIDLNGYMDLVQAALHHSLEDEPVSIQNPDSMFLLGQWNAWQQGYSDQPEVVKETIQQSLPELIRLPSGVNQYREYIEDWYAETGISFNNLVVPGTEATTEEMASKPPVYLVDTFYDDLSSELTLSFTLIDGEGSELYEAELEVQTFDRSTRHELLFTGETDTLVKSIPASTEFVTVHSVSLPDRSLKFGRYPMYFILNQLRSADKENRLLAAELLQKNADNPDLQLALNDVMADEENPEVQAQLLLALAAVTNGAIGTEEIFITELNNASHHIQTAAVKALRNYPGNEMAINSVRSKIISTESDTLYKAALGTFSEIADGEMLNSLVNRISRSDSTGLKTLGILNEVVNVENLEDLIATATDYMSTSYPNATREAALRFLITYDDDSERWENRLDDLANDYDPRIRYLALNGVMKMSPSEAIVYLNSADEKEFDIRIIGRMEELKREISTR